MRIPHSLAGQHEFSVSMTPMIDVVFLLLIFFVCTASFQISEAVLPSPLSTGDTSEDRLPPELKDIDLERVLIEVTQEGAETHLAINGQACPTVARLSETLAALIAIDRTLQVILDIAGETPLAAAIDVYDRCRLAGFQRIQFAASVEP